jgi:hypothetical protein
MRVSRLAEWVAGGVAGCPGTVDTTASDDSPTPAPAPQVRAVSVADPSTRQRQRRGQWVTAAAVILVAEGSLAILYLPGLMASSMWPLPTVAIPIGALAVLNVAAGLLRLRRWARSVALAVSSFVLLFMYAPALTAAVANGVWLGFDWPGVVGYLVVLFAVLRRWPAEPVGAD